MGIQRRGHWHDCRGVTVAQGGIEDLDLSRRGNQAFGRYCRWTGLEIGEHPDTGVRVTRRWRGQSTANPSLKVGLPAPGE